MSDRLWQRSTPRELSKFTQTVEFEGRVSDFERLDEALGKGLSVLDDDASKPDWSGAVVTGTLSCRPTGVPDTVFLTGSVHAAVDMVCQRSLTPMVVRLEVPIDYALGQGLGDTLNDVEVWELDGPTVRLGDLVDESLVLALPMVPMLETENDAVAPDAAETENEEMRRPFADLRKQMQEDEH